MELRDVIGGGVKKRHSSPPNNTPINPTLKLPDNVGIHVVADKEGLGQEKG